MQCMCHLCPIFSRNIVQQNFRLAMGTPFAGMAAYAYLSHLGKYGAARTSENLTVR